MSKYKKKGESGGSAAVLLSLIGLFILLYILFLPSDLRDELLNGEINENGTFHNHSESSINYRVILKKSPGFLGKVKTLLCDNNECLHRIPTFSLYKTTQSEVLVDFNPFIIRNNIFKKDFHTVNFEVPRLTTTDNMILSASAKKHKGTLKIMLNGEKFYESNVESYNLPPIKIPKEMLQPTNQFEFQVSNVGAKFWDTNEYSIENMKIVGDVTDLSKNKNIQSFFISPEEYKMVDLVKLKFFPDCEEVNVGMLQIKLNSREIYNAVPDCGMLNILELSKDVLRENENSISFKTNYGSYLIDQISLWTHMKSETYPVYYFDLEEEEYNSIKDNETDLNITVELAKRPDEDVNFFMFVNGHTKSVRINEDERTITRKIPEYDLKHENNWIRIEPDSKSINVAEIKLEVRPKD